MVNLWEMGYNHIVKHFDTLSQEEEMSKIYVCGACGYEYDPAVGDPDNGIAPGTPFEALPDDWECPLCGLGKDVFEEKKD